MKEPSMVATAGFHSAARKSFYALHWGMVVSTTEHSKRGYSLKEPRSQYTPPGKWYLNARHTISGEVVGKSFAHLSDRGNGRNDTLMDTTQYPVRYLSKSTWGKYLPLLPAPSSTKDLKSITPVGYTACHLVFLNTFGLLWINSTNQPVWPDCLFSFRIPLLYQKVVEIR